MSLHILKPGLLDTIQDRGRFGYAQLGINPSGAMDTVALAVSNLLTGNAAGDAVLEMHFPAPALCFQSDALFALAGADFDARLNGRLVPVHTPVLVAAGGILEFRKPVSGVRCYLAVAGGFDLEPWLGSYSTHSAVQTGGFKGRALQTGDMLPFRRQEDYTGILQGKNSWVLPWKANVSGLYASGDRLRFCAGPEYDYLTSESKYRLETARWKVARQSDRMGYGTEGPALTLTEPLELVSAAVVPGTIQLLPNGHFIVLMADSQTTGGYPRIGHIISADLPKLAQMGPGAAFGLKQVDLETAMEEKYRQAQWIRQMGWGNFFNVGKFIPRV